MSDAEPNSGDCILECREATVCRGGRAVLRDVNLRIGRSECLSIIGPNGSGKTTLLMSLLGLLPPHRGLILLARREITKIPPRARGRFAAYVPQVQESAPAFRVIDVVSGGRYPHASSLRSMDHEDRMAVRKAIEQCNLESLADRPFHAISGGERQKTLIAAAIAQDAAVMFLDEPNTALDPAYQIELVRILREWHAAGRGIVLVSHDLQLPAALGGRVVALNGGQIAADGPVNEVLTSTRLEAVYGAPFAEARLGNGTTIVLPQWWQG